MKASQDLAGEINHKSEGVEVSGIDWNAKVYVIPLNDNLEQMKSFDEKVDRRTVLSLYEIKLVDVLTGEEYEGFKKGLRNLNMFFEESIEHTEKRGKNR